MHRKIRAVVRASSLDEAVAKSVEGLENAMKAEILADGTLSTLAGEHTAFSPSTYFDDGRQQAGYKVDTSEGEQDLREAVSHMQEHGSTFIYSIDERGSLTASPIPSQQTYEWLKSSLDESQETHWVVAFDLRYDFDAAPNKPYEILD